MSRHVTAWSSFGRTEDYGCARLKALSCPHSSGVCLGSPTSLFCRTNVAVRRKLFTACPLTRAAAFAILILQQPCRGAAVLFGERLRVGS